MFRSFHQRLCYPRQSGYALLASALAVVLALLGGLAPAFLLPAFAQELDEGTEASYISVVDSTPDLTAAAALLVDQNSGMVLYENNAHELRYPASITKIMTALLVLERIDDLSQYITVTEDDLAQVPYDSSTADLQAGDVMTVYDMLCALLIPSGNDAACVLARCVSGSIEDFATLMNERATELGCVSTHFVNPHGIHDDDHYTCASDLVLIMEAVLRYPVFSEISSMARYTLPGGAEHEPHEIENTDPLVIPDSGVYMASVTASKTGTTYEAGKCLIVAAEQDDLSVIGVVLGSTWNPGEDEISWSAKDMKSLLEWGFSAWSYRDVVSSGDVIAQLSLSSSAQVSELAVAASTPVYALVPSDTTLEDLRIEPCYISTATDSPVEAGDYLGYADVYFEERYLGSVWCVAAADTGTENDAVLSEGLSLADFVDRAGELALYLPNLLLVGAVVLLGLIVFLVSTGRQDRRSRGSGGRFGGDGHSFILVFLAGSLALISLACSPQDASAGEYSADTPPELSCTAAYLVDLDTGYVLLDKNADERCYPASTTKIMTALVVLEQVSDLSQTVTVEAEDLESLPDGSSLADLYVGDSLSVYDLLAGLLIPSGNDAAMVLARFVGGSVEAFADLMNEKATELGCVSTHFVNPHGLHDDDHYTCASDLALIMEAALQYPVFLEISGMASYMLPGDEEHAAHEIVTTNQLLDPESGFYRGEEILASKTGSTAQAGQCMVTAADDGTMRLVAVVLHSYDDETSEGLMYRAYDTGLLLDWGFGAWVTGEILSVGDTVSSLPVELSKDGETVDLTSDTAIYTTVPAGTLSQDYTIVTDLSTESLRAPVEAGEYMGSASIYLKDRFLGTVGCLTAQKMRFSVWKLIMEWLSVPGHIGLVMGIVVAVFIVSGLLGALSRHRHLPAYRVSSRRTGYRSRESSAFRPSSTYDAGSGRYQLNKGRIRRR